MTSAKNILLTGGRSPTALFLARELAKKGHRIFVAETSALHVCRFSNAVKKAYVVPSPRFETAGFIAAIRRIVEEQHIDLVLPTYEEILYLAEAADQFPADCFRWIPPFEQLNRLHNKWLFHNRLLEFGLQAPPAYLVRSKEELETLPFTEPFAMKPCYSRASQQVLRVVPGEESPAIDIEPYNPWVAQHWLHGRKICTFSLADQGKLRAHTAYPVDYAIEGNSCLVFSAIEHPKIQQWVAEFVEKEKFTGQIAFDFIETEDGTLYPLECNPRATSGLYLFAGLPDLDTLFFPEAPPTTPLTPKPGTSKQIAAGMLIYGWQHAISNRQFLPFLKTFFSVGDVVFAWRDIMPFLAEPFVMVRYLTQSRQWRLKVFAAFTYDCDWNNESFQNLQLE